MDSITYRSRYHGLPGRIVTKACLCLLCRYVVATYWCMWNQLAELLWTLAGFQGLSHGTEYSSTVYCNTTLASTVHSVYAHSRTSVWFQSMLEFSRVPCTLSTAYCKYEYRYTCTQVHVYRYCNATCMGLPSPQNITSLRYRYCNTRNTYSSTHVYRYCTYTCTGR